MRANDLFRDLGLKKIVQNNTTLNYLRETDYEMLHVNFDLTLETYCITYERFIDRDDIVFVPMNERPENIKHSCGYGHWQSEMYIDVGVKLHNAIHQQLIELGWIK